MHPRKPSLRPKRVLPIVPDAGLWANRYRQIVFDDLPHTANIKDLLFKTTPTPRVTCFSYFAPAGEGAEPGSYRLVESYVWENRGSHTRSVANNDNDAVLLSLPLDDDEAGEARFVPTTPIMRLRKQKAHSLEIKLDVPALTVRERDISAREAAEEHERLNAVLSEEIREDSEPVIDFVNGEWNIRDPRGASADTTPPGTPLAIPSSR